MRGYWTCVFVCVSLTGLALSITESTERLGCAPYGRRSGGRLTRAVHGPLSLSPHPCRSSPYATPKFGLLKGTGPRACEISGRSKSVAFGFCSSTAMVQTTPKSPSGGRVESPRKGLSDMDVARAAMGQGWPFAACPWSGDGTREPRRSRGRMVGCPSLWLLSLGQARESDSPVRGETKTKDRHANDPCPDINSAKRTHKLAALACPSPIKSPHTQCVQGLVTTSQ